MALLGFDDGSYVELIAPQQPGSADSTSGWGKKMAENAGVCAWAVGSADIKDELERLSRLGIATGRARAGSRKKPDGAVLQWETATLGKGDPGATLPFLIQDHTPCSLRVQPSASVKGSELTGAVVVVIAVRDLEASITLFRRAYGWPAPATSEQPEFGARLAYFTGTPVMLASPLDAKAG